MPAGSGSQARQMAEKQEFEIAVVDNRLPDERGFQVISAVQKPGVSTVALLRDEDTMDRIVGIELGADYYMRSPVNPRELVARVKQILRKREYASGGSSGRLFVGELEIDPDQVSVRKGDKEILLSPREFKLLHTLARSPGRVFPRDALLRQVWGEDEYIDERTVNVYVQRLRNNHLTGVSVKKWTFASFVSSSMMHCRNLRSPVAILTSYTAKCVMGFLSVRFNTGFSITSTDSPSIALRVQEPLIS